MAVDVPDAHLQSGLAPAQAQSMSGASIPMNIRHSREQPSSLYRVQHRGYWFYTDETDSISKQIFTGIMTLYVATLDSVAPGSQGPQLVLPIGGG